MLDNNLKALSNCVVVEPEIETHEMFVLLGENKTGHGTVLAAGPRVEHLKVGDVITFGQSVGQKFRFEGKDRLVMREEHVLGVLEETATA